MHDRAAPLNIGSDDAQALRVDHRVKSLACREMTIERYCHAGHRKPGRGSAIATNEPREAKLCLW